MFKVALMEMVSILLCAIAGSVMSIISRKPVSEGMRTAVQSWGFETSFLFILAGCYIVSPFLIIVVENVQLEKYFLVLAMIFCWEIPSIVDLDYVQNVMPDCLVTLATWIDNAQIYIPMGSMMLFVVDIIRENSIN